MKKIRKIEYSKILLIFFGILVSFFTFLFILEVYLRITNKITLTPLTPMVDYWLTRKDNEKQYRLSKDLLLGWEIIPGSNANSLKANSLGFFDKERNIRKGKNVYRICVLGDSIPAGHRRFVEYLEEMLNKNSKHNNFEVWNCGVTGYEVLQYYANLRNKVIKFNPDMIIISFCLNDFSAQPILYKSKDGKVYSYNIGNPFPYLVNSELFIKYRVYKLFTLVARNFVSKLNKSKIIGENFSRLDRGRWAIKRILEITKHENIKVVGIIIPYLKSNYNKDEQKQYEEIKQVLDEYEIPHLDLHGKFKNIDDLKWKKEQNDYIHPSTYGHKFIAEKLYKFFIDTENW